MTKSRSYAMVTESPDSCITEHTSCADIHLMYLMATCFKETFRRDFSFRQYAWISICGLAAACTPCRGQAFSPVNTDVAIGGTSQLTTPIQPSATAPQSWALGTAGVIVSVQEHPHTWAGYDVSFRYGRDGVKGESSAVGGSNGPVRYYEVTGAYLMHARFSQFQPFLGIGAGAVYFDPTSGSGGELRAAGFLEAGVDIPTVNPHFGFRIQGRSLYYRSPTMELESTGAERWVATAEPSASVYIRF